jgi:hypothetical protein
MSDAGAFFDEITAETGDVARNGRGMPMLVPRGQPLSVRAPYTRASSMADRVKDMRHIATWEKRYLARAMSEPANRDLAELAAAEIYTTGFDKPDDEANKRSGRILDDVIRRALDRQGIHQKADRGTTVHKYAEDRGRIWEAPEAIQPYLRSYWARLDNDGIEVHFIEMFVANDEVMAAGTFDSICWHPAYGWVTCDIKTGKIDPGYVVQEAIYANGELYDKKTHERAPLESLTKGEMIRRDVGLIFQVTPNKDGEIETKIIEVDLERGWRLAKAIKVVHDELRADVFSEIPARTLEQRIMAVKDAAEMKKLWNETKDSWGSKHLEAGRVRRAQMEEAPNADS